MRFLILTQSRSGLQVVVQNYHGFTVIYHASSGGSSSFALTEVELDFDWSTGPVAFSLDFNVFGDGRTTGVGTDVN